MAMSCFMSICGWSAGERTNQLTEASGECVSVGSLQSGRRADHFEESAAAHPARADAGCAGSSREPQGVGAGGILAAGECVQSRERLRIRRGASSASCCAMTPPMEWPTTCADSQPARSISAGTSSPWLRWRSGPAHGTSADAAIIEDERLKAVLQRIDLRAPPFTTTPTPWIRSICGP